MKYRKTFNALRFISGIIALVVAAAMLAGCNSERSIKFHLSETLSVDCSQAEITDQYDSHGGFLGDGTSFYALQFKDDSQVIKISGSKDWKPLPLSDSLKTAVWGLQDEEHDFAPMIIKDNDWNHPLIPQVKNGYFFFLDRHSYATNPKDDTAFLDQSRPSYNFTVAIYDTDSNILYFSQLDT